MAGYDCSGFCIEILKSVGVLPRKGDWTAEGLMNRFLHNRVDIPKEGCLVFWTSSTDPLKIIHVEYCLDDLLAIGASGGGSKNQTVDDAIKNNAYIKVRPMKSRNNIWGYVDPFQY
jgi:hypothetical protein